MSANKMVLNDMKIISSDDGQVTIKFKPKRPSNEKFDKLVQDITGGKCNAASSLEDIYSAMLAVKEKEKERVQEQVENSYYAGFIQGENEAEKNEREQVRE